MTGIRVLARLTEIRVLTKINRKLALTELTENFVHIDKINRYPRGDDFDHNSPH